MQIEIRLCNSLATACPSGASFSLVLQNGATLAEALARIGLQPQSLAMVLCNGQSVHDESGILDEALPLRDGDHLVISSHDPAARPRRNSFVEAFRQIVALLRPLTQKG